MARRIDLDALERGIISGDRGQLARAITLIESRRSDDEQMAQDLLGRILPKSGGAIRLGVSGPPGVGKSTFIEALGIYLIGRGHRVAVLAVDPSSRVSGGSILGDKSRMNELAQKTEAFIRPSPSAATLGGVARRSREVLTVCEAAGFDVVIVETVGVGQSETAVADMVDTFLVLAQPGAGDELQGIKRGILELADIVAVNKADGIHEPAARAAVEEISAAFRYARIVHDAWRPQALMMSALHGQGLDAVWNAILAHRTAIEDSARGGIEGRRGTQRLQWLNEEIRLRVLAHIEEDEDLAAGLLEMREAVKNGTLTPSQAAQDLVKDLLRRSN